jgi:hypothetical protein
MMKNILFLLLATSLFASCKKDEIVDPPAPAMLRFKYKFDSTQVRLDGLGNPETLPAGNGAQSPVFRQMSSHYIELATDMWTGLGAGEVVYHAPESSAGGSVAIDFSQGVRKGDGEIFFSIPLSDVTPGTYRYLRVSQAYQNYDVKISALGLPVSGRVASFIGYNTYISSFQIKDSTVTVNDDKLQGFWGVETAYSVITGQAPPGATTVPNPIFATSPVPAGSCVVTGEILSPLVITGDETEDIVVVVSLSTNKSFEWTETDGDNIYEPLDGETVIDMGIRGMIPWIE